jgi:hypothetical protein
VISRIIRAAITTVCILFALCAGAAAYFALLGNAARVDQGVVSFHGPTPREAWALVQGGALIFAERVSAAAADAEGRFRAARTQRRVIVDRPLSSAAPRAAGAPGRALPVNAARSAALRPVSSAAGEKLGDMVRTLPPVLRVKTAEERRVEELIEKVFLGYFRDYTIAGRRMSLRMPFALNDERESGRFEQLFYKEGKGVPEDLWPYIDSVLASAAFKRYTAQIASPGEKAVVFNLARRSYAVSRDRHLVDALGRDAYPGTPTRIFVRRSEAELTEADVYNYLYAVAAVGVDCSGFSYHLHEVLAKVYGVDLNRLLARGLKADPRLVRNGVGLYFFDPASGYTEPVADRIVNLRPGDMILYRGSDGKLKHSAVIQSIDFEKGIIRYMQSTDWALEAERGVHLSMIRFEPERARESLRHYTVRWLQQVRPPFEGEEEPRDWLTDGDRYLWYTAAGGSLVVRPRYLVPLFLAAEPLYYTNIGLDGSLEQTLTPGGSGRPAIPPRRIAR